MRTSIRVDGIVQGVGFRPHVHRLAAGLGLAGFVRNDDRGVLVEVEGPPATIETFLDRLVREAPVLAAVERVEAVTVETRGETGFTIDTSTATGSRDVMVSPDIATCADCLAEIAEPTDRRFRYPFTNCTNCGPRYTIVRDVPYDRPVTTMAGFPMCAECAAEYADPADRRFHAQPVCCPACGPRLRLVGPDGEDVAGDPIAEAASLLRAGAVVAIKGLGGYHLAAAAGDEDATAALRARKHREEKPFAVMVADLDVARRLCVVGADEAGLLASPARPIVLLARREHALVARAVAPANRALGLMLPYTPLHSLLCAEVGGPFVLTSGNVSDEPIAFRDADASVRLGPIADAILTHDRPIHTRVDDSVVRVVGGRPLPLRRSRGYAPRPVTVPWESPRHVLGVGAELKSTICLAKGRHAFVSPHIGDLENYETFASFVEAIEQMTRLFDVRPEVVAHDLHPEYLSTKHALELDGVDLVGVQHHHAHIASCLADNDMDREVIGVAFDGTGYGTDATIWGGEVLVCDLAGSRRVGCLDPVPMPGGAAAIREPWRMAAAHLRAAYGERIPDGMGVAERNASRWADVLTVAAAGLNSPPTSSAGRLFDAVASILDVRDEVTYEGQAAIELEQAAAVGERDGYVAGIVPGDPFRIRGGDLVRAVVEDRRSGTGPAVVAARFHNGVVATVVAACVKVREDEGLEVVALSGGVFQNALLVEACVRSLQAAGFEVLTHRRVPPNDGGISLGQVAVAAALDRRR